MKLRATLLALALILALVLPLTLAAPSPAETLMVNGQNIWHEAKAKVLDNTTYVSLRTVSRILAPDTQVSWSNGTASVAGDGVELAAVPGNHYLTINDRALYIPGGVLSENGSVLVPIRVLAEALGGSVDWSRATGVTLTVGSGHPSAIPYTDDQLYWLSRIISAESQGEPLLGKLAVGNVVLNRVASDEFPDTIYGVIFDREWGVQFTPVANGTVYDQPTEESILAAKLVLDGAQVVDKCLYFLAPDLTDNHWIMENREYVTTIGCHWFYQ